MTTRLTRQRVFFALWPDPGTRAALTRLQAPLQGRMVRAQNLHLTLAFLGTQDEAACARLCAVLDQLPFEALTLELSRYGYFARAHTVWAGLAAPSPALARLHGALAQRLAMEWRLAARPFEAHVTLARDASAPSGSAFAPLLWRVDQIALLASAPDGADYRVIAARSS